MGKVKVKIDRSEQIEVKIYGITEAAVKDPISALWFAYVLGRELGVEDDYKVTFCSEGNCGEYVLELDFQSETGSGAAYYLIKMLKVWRNRDG